MSVDLSVDLERGGEGGEGQHLRHCSSSCSSSTTGRSSSARAAADPLRPIVSLHQGAAITQRHAPPAAGGAAERLVVWREHDIGRSLAGGIGTSGG